MFKALATSFIVLFCFTGCAKPHPVKPPPKWISNPYQNGKIGAVGSAKIHFKGDAEQRRLAISRALDELAHQQGVEVTSQILRKEKSDAFAASSESEVYSFQKNSGEVIHAHIEAVWKDPRNGELFIWMIKE